MKALVHSSNDPCKRPFFLKGKNLLPLNLWLDVWVPQNEKHDIGALYTPALFSVKCCYLMQGFCLMRGGETIRTVFFGIN